MSFSKSLLLAPLLLLGPAKAQGASESQEVAPQRGKPTPTESTQGSDKAHGSAQASETFAPHGARGLTSPLPGKAFHRERRATLMKRVGGGVILVRGAANVETYYRFHQSHNFFYLTGVEEPDCELILIPETGEEILIVPPRNPFFERWEGVGVLPGAKGVAQTGIARVIPGSSRTLIRELKDALARCGEQKTIWVEFEPEEKGAASRDNLVRAHARWARDPLDGRKGRNEHARQALAKHFEDAKIENLSPELDAMRTIKQAAERALLEYSARLACLGIAEAMKACRAGQREYELAAVAEYAFKRHGAQSIGYMAIVGSGPNGCVLHHWRNRRKMKAGELVVMDFAPSVNGYVADVTRTFPVGGKFNAETRKLVQDVHDAQQAIIAAIKPGVSLSKLSRIGSRLLVARGYKPGIHILHGPCHHLGMAVHDVSRNGRVLREGMYITVEPGAYLTKKGMGCRIEDCILVTKDGCEVLSKGCPSTPDEIEALMRSAGLSEVPTGR